MNTKTKIIISLVTVAVVGIVSYLVWSSGGGYGANGDGQSTTTTQKPLTVAEQKDLLNELAKPVSSEVKPMNQDEQVKLLEQLAKPVEGSAVGTPTNTVEAPAAKPFSVDEQMKLLEQLKAQ
jgi:hypothetical protein